MSTQVQVFGRRRCRQCRSWRVYRSHTYDRLWMRLLLLSIGRCHDCGQLDVRPCWQVLTGLAEEQAVNSQV